MIKILLTEDHQIVRTGIRNVLETSGQFKVVGEASNGKETLRLLREGTFPDIILADLNMPEMSGIELAENVKKTQGNRDVKLVMLTMLDNENYVFEAFRMGASGYLLKNISTDEMLFALKHIAENNQYISSNLAVRIMKQAENRSGTEDISIDFSKRETEVLALIAAGYTNKEIADKLFTSRRTVEGHRQTMINKANVRNSAELIRFAVKHSLID
ncbi:MAG: response regulator transcription factor [Bacteroidetes bacterium]|nr:response regulator transcription factor [Bacteroidota bacterium]